MNYFGLSSFSKTYITTAASNVIFTGTGGLMNVTINKAVTGTIKLYDNGVLFGTIAASTPAQTMNYAVGISSGLTIVNASTEDLTIAFLKDQ